MMDPTRTRRTPAGIRGANTYETGPGVLTRQDTAPATTTQTSFRPFVLREVADRRSAERRADPPTHTTTKVITQPDPRQLLALDEVLRDHVDQEISKARLEGETAGYERGRSEALERSQTLGAAISLAATELIDFSESEKLLALNSVMELAERVATLVMNRTPHDGGQAALSRVRDVLDQLDDGPFTIAVNADDLDVVAAGVNNADVVVAADSTLQPGEARVRGLWSYSDLTQAAAWESVRAALSTSDEPLDP